MTPAKTTTRKSPARKTKQLLTDGELAAMKETLRERKAAASEVEGENAVLAKIAEMEGPDRALATRVHNIIKASAPGLLPKLWYGMPSYAKDGKVVCFFQPALKFKARYSTVGFNDSANLDEGTFWPTAFALKELTPAVEERISALVRKAAS